MSGNTSHTVDRFSVRAQSTQNTSKPSKGDPTQLSFWSILRLGHLRFMQRSRFQNSDEVQVVSAIVTAHADVEPTAPVADIPPTQENEPPQLVSSSTILHCAAVRI